MGCSCSSPELERYDPDTDLEMLGYLLISEAEPALVDKPAALALASDASTVASEGDAEENEEGKRGVPSKFQIQLEGQWENYCDKEDAVLKRAYLVGHPRARYRFRGQDYEYDFEAMRQTNLSTGKQRKIRPPGFMRPPRAPLLPPGNMVVVTVPEAAVGRTMEINDPNNAGATLEVLVPPGARAGARMAVPVPQQGETAADVRTRQEAHSTGAQLRRSGALVLGGAILGAHLTRGEAREWAAAGEVEGIGAWAEGAGEDADGWAHDAAEDVADWLAGAADDAADFVMELF